MTDLGGSDAAGKAGSALAKSSNTFAGVTEELDHGGHEPEQPEQSVGMSKIGEGEEENKDIGSMTDIPVVPWLRQLRFGLQKNQLLIIRRPLLLVVMLLGSVASTLFAWATAEDDNKYDFDTIPLDECGTVNFDFYADVLYQGQNNSDSRLSRHDSAADEIPVSHNEQWRSGFAVALLGLGPMMLAICVYLYIQPEFEMKMVGVLRGLGMRESVYWLSWWIPFTIAAVINAVLGALTAVLIENVHAFQHTSFGSIMVAFFFLSLALISASFLLAAMGSSSKVLGAIFIMVMVVTAWVPYLITSTSGSTTATVGNVNYGLYTPTGVFWVNGNTSFANVYSGSYYENASDWTSNITYYYTTSSCEQPLMGTDEGYNMKTPEERYDVTPDSYFLGCYFGAGFGSQFTMYGGFSKFVMAAIPYTGFMAMWGNFLGYTGMPNREFGLNDFSRSPESLALRSMGPLDPANAQGTSLYPQGSVLTRSWVNSQYDSATKTTLYNCPASNLSDSFCSLNSCDVSEETEESLSSSGWVGILLAFSIFYGLLAAYWSQVFTGGNGAGLKYYFPFTKGYWFQVRPQRAEVPKGGVGVSTDSVSKIYGSNHAVNNVDVSFAVGEVTALLGHNGAGKTTLSHMLCCETEPSDGSASIFGRSVVTDRLIVRQLVGICKQDDYLYPNLTAREHLELFGGLRGVPDEDLPVIVQEWLESVDLGLVQNSNSSGFSGGMKRRLSVACSTIGGRPFIVLDEPTTGMDPVSRRFVWKHVDSIKDGRVVLLTTHAMEEADLLADTVVIMRGGVVAASGSPLQLKAEHGSSIQFSLLIEQDDMDRTMGLIRDHFSGFEEWVDVKDGGAGNVTVAISKVREQGLDDGVTVETLAEFASFLESGASGVREYGFSNSSLEEVFLQVTKEKGDESKYLDEETKELDLEKSKTGETDGEDDDQVSLTIDDGNTQVAIGSYESNLSLRSQLSALTKFLLIRDWTGKSSIANYVILSVLLAGTVLVSPVAANNTVVSGIFFLIEFTLTALLWTLVIPVFYERFAGLSYLVRAQGMMKQSFLVSQIVYSFLLGLLFAFVLLSLVYATPLFDLSEVCEKGADWGECSSQYADPMKIDYYDQKSLPDWDDTYEGEPVTVYVRRAPGSYGQMMGIVVAFALTMPGMVFTSSHLPGYKLGISLLTVGILVLGVLPPIMFALFNGRGGKERDECVWDICNTTFFGNETTVDGVDFLNCAGYTANQGQLGALCIPPVAALLPQMGVFQSLWMVIMTDVAITSEPSIYAQEILMPKLTGGDYDCDGTTCTFPYARDQYGSFVGFTVLGGVILAVAGFFLVSFFSYPGRRTLAWKNTFSNSMRTFFCCLWGKKMERAQVSTVESPEEVLEETNLVEDVVAPFVAGHGEGEQGEQHVAIPDYTAIPRDEIPPVLAYKLRKEYILPGGRAVKVALNSLDLHVPYGQVLGLLGKNGAGKTTALKIFAGAHDSTSGIALVSGYDIATEQLRVFERLGNCAQFDSVWPLESVKTHLEFFGGLKGLPPDRLKEIALSVAMSVGLGAPEVYKRAAGALSGGMRRRLSIAIALIGAPGVLLLDEPTTGLDPSTRNTIWDLINSFATEKRAIIITTHMMLEADSLCTRIAIMAKGNLRTIGTQQWLKNTFGAGYLLQLNLTSSDQENQDRAMSFVRERLHPDAILQSRQAKTLHVALPRDVSLADVFRVLYSPDRFEAGSINQFLFSQSSLEDVFVALGE